MTRRAPIRTAQRWLGALLALASLPPPTASQTFTADSAMPVKVEIIQACSVSAADLDFGHYNLAAPAPAQGQTTIQLNCGVGVIAELSLDNGLSPGPNTSKRRMRQETGNDRLDYDLFQDAARTVHWGDKSGVDTREVLTTGTQQTVPIYGEIPASQRASDGTYSDEITVRVQF